MNRRVHATDGPVWWCAGEFTETPDHFVGFGHSAAPLGFPVHTCRRCGDELFIDYDVDPRVPSWDEINEKMKAAGA